MDLIRPGARRTGLGQYDGLQLEVLQTPEQVERSVIEEIHNTCTLFIRVSD